jgi:hypothetical protein
MKDEYTISLEYALLHLYQDYMDAKAQYGEDAVWQKYDDEEAEIAARELLKQSGYLS